MISRLLKLLLLLVSICSAAFAQGIPLIVGEADREKWEAIGRVNIGGFKTKGVCTGTLIAPDLVITAAHCVAQKNSATPLPFYRVFFVAGRYGETYTAASKAARIVVHSNYKGLPQQGQTLENLGYDLALITLEKPMPDIAPIPLSAGRKVAGPVAVIGYLRTNPLLPHDYVGCRSFEGNEVLVPLSCYVESGISGAPVLSPTDQGWQLFGVVSSQVNQENSPIKGLAAAFNTSRKKELEALSAE